MEENQLEESDGANAMPTVEEREAQDLDELDQERELLEQLQQLHKKLAKVRSSGQAQPLSNASTSNADGSAVHVQVVASAHSESSTTTAASGDGGTNLAGSEAEDSGPTRCPRFLEDGSSKLVVCAVRKPLRMIKSRKGDAWAYRRSQSGFNSSIDFIASENRVQWVAWAGAYVEPGTREAVKKRLEAEHHTTPVFLSRATQSAVEGFWWKTLWPTLHTIPTDFDGSALKPMGDHQLSGFDSLKMLSSAYCERVAEVYCEGDLILIYDHELMLLPALLRRRFPGAAIGFFLHTPFPSSEVFQELPCRSDLLHGLLGADIISFNHFDYVRHFTNACTRILGLEARNTFERGRHCSFEYQGRLIALEICPAGIDPQKFAPAAASPAPALVTPSSSSAAIAAAAATMPLSASPSPSTTTDAAAGVAATAAAATATAAASVAAETATALAANAAVPAADSASATAAAIAAATASSTAAGTKVYSEGVAVAAASFEQRQQQQHLKEEREESLTPGSGASSHINAAQALPPPPAPLSTSSSNESGGDYSVHDYQHENSLANQDEDGSELALRLAWRCQRNGGKVVVLLAAGLDWCKGLPQMLVALAAFFHRNPSWRSHVTVFVVVRDVPGRADPSLRQMVSRLVGYVNGRYGSVCHQPVAFVHRTLTLGELSGLYAAADVAIVGSIREGVNLAAMEFVAAQSFSSRDQKGVLLYSEFAGCASSFQGATLVNPYDAEGVAKHLLDALVMREQTKRVRHHTLERYVSKYTSELWAVRTMNGLLEARLGKRPGLSSYDGAVLGVASKLDPSHLLSFYERSARRLLVLDYDGALASHQPLAQLSHPGEALRALLHALSSDPANVVVVVTGRRRADVEDWFCDLPRLGLIADHGFWMRPPSRPQPSHHLPPPLHSLLESPEPSTTSPDGISGISDGSTTAADAAVTGLPALSLGARALATAAAGSGSGSAAAATSAPEPDHHGRTYSREMDDSGSSTGGSGSGGGGGHSGSAGGVGRDRFDSAGSARSLDLPPRAVEPLEEQAREWEQLGRGDYDMDLGWMVEVLPILEDFTKRTPGSLLEASDCCLTWYYRDADADFGSSQAKNVQLQLDQMLRRRPVRVCTVAAHYKFLVVQPLRVTKGRALAYLLTRVLPEADRQDAEEDAKRAAEQADRAALFTLRSDSMPSPRMRGAADLTSLEVSRSVDGKGSRDSVDGSLTASGWDLPPPPPPLMLPETRSPGTLGPGDIGYEGVAPLAPESPPASPPFRIRKVASVGESPSLDAHQKGSGRDRSLRDTTGGSLDGYLDRSDNSSSEDGYGGGGGGVVDSGGLRKSRAPVSIRDRRASSENDKDALLSELDPPTGDASEQPAAIKSHQSNPILGSPALVGASGAVPTAPTSASAAAAAAAAVASAMAAARKFDMVLAVSDDRTHEDLPSAWREGPSAALPALAQLAHGVFAVSSAGPAARTRAKYYVEDTSELLMVLRALADVSERAAQSGQQHGGLERASSTAWSSSSRLSSVGSTGTL